MKRKSLFDSNFDKPGVYFIKNILSDRVYIGSTTMTVLKRMSHHYGRLISNKHKNSHLQNAWNLYGEENFEFLCVENVEKFRCLDLEQEYIDGYVFETLYNINPLATGTPNMSLETIAKRAQTCREKYASGEFTHGYKKGNIPWNKGKLQGEIDYSYLKGVKKVISEENKEKRRDNFIKTMSEKSVSLYVYDLNYNFLGFWKNAKELQNDSLKEDFILKNNMVLKNKIGRNGYSPFILQPFNTQKSIKTGLPYKGLLFRNKNLTHAYFKLDELLETP
jgi:group I intron endonuclease